MALDSDRLANNVVNALDASSAVDINDTSKAKEIWKIIAAEIVSEFENNGVVNTTVASGIRVDDSNGTKIGDTAETGSGTGSIT